MLIICIIIFILVTKKDKTKQNEKQTINGNLHVFSVGGKLEVVLEQDHHLPESAVMKFGLDIVRGLHYLHSLGILYCDLQPSKVSMFGMETNKTFVGLRGLLQFIGVFAR